MYAAHLVTPTSITGSKSCVNSDATLSANPPAASGVGRWFSDHFAKPTMLLASGLGLLFNGSQKSIQMWVDNRQKNKPVTSRLDIKHIQRNKKDLVRVFPAAIFLAVPFAVPLLPHLFRIAPGFMPSVFVTDEFLTKKMQVLERKRTALAPTLLADLTAALTASVSSAGGSQAELLLRRWNTLLAHPARATESDLVSLQLLLRDHANIIDLPKPALRSFNRFVGIAAPIVAPQARLFAWIDWILKDDGLLRAEGVNALTEYELLEALEERGFIHLTNQTPIQLRGQLSRHLKFTKVVSDAILLRSRAAAKRADHRAPVPTVIPAEDVASMASMVLAARALNIHSRV
ncbi:hypothetical protein HKX48_008369 [Thoreauomyces humboldtii]|nr:hypothetical protein HKX48_008369 [Thoreauomyces humboldtii]